MTVENAIIPSDVLLKKLDTLPYTSRKGLTKPFSKQSDKVKEKVFIVLRLLVSNTIKRHSILQTKNPQQAYHQISRDTFYELVGRNWDCIRKYLKSNNIIQVEPSDTSKATYASGYDKSGVRIRGVKSRSIGWRINPRYFNLKYFTFKSIDGEKGSVTLHGSISDHFTDICKKRKWHKAVEFMQAYQIHTFNYKPMSQVTGSKYGREFNKVNTLPREVREFVLIDGEETQTIDYSAASLTILTPNVSAVRGERDRWIQLLNNDIYSAIAGEFGVSRDTIKKDIVRWVGCNAKDQSYGVFKMNFFLEKYFPITYQDFQADDVNLVEYTQTIESKIIVEVFENRGISIHDALLVKSSDVEEIHPMMMQVMEYFTTNNNITHFDSMEFLFADFSGEVTGRPNIEPKSYFKGIYSKTEPHGKELSSSEYDYNWLEGLKDVSNRGSTSDLDELLRELD